MKSYFECVKCGVKGKNLGFWKCDHDFKLFIKITNWIDASALLTYNNFYNRRNVERLKREGKLPENY